jgi:phage gpG-like protein
MVTSQIQVFGEKQAARRLENIGDQAANARPAMEEIYLTILDIEDETFDREGARGGFPRWLQNAPATLLWKARHRYHPAILRATDALRTAMTTYRHPDQVVRISNVQIMFQPKLTRIPYGRIQQKGGRTKMTQGKGPGGKVTATRFQGGRERRVFIRQYTHIPARPYVRFTESDANAFAKEILRHIMRPKLGRGRIGVNFDG